MTDLKRLIRTIPDFPEPGIQYRDITTLLQDPDGLREAVRRMADAYRDAPPDFVAGIDARGFIFGAAVAIELGCGFVPIRKAGKLPGETIEQDYDLEYGSATLQIHTQGRRAGERAVLIDDLIATGGTALAGVSLLRATGAKVVGACFLVDLPDLGGAKKLETAGVPTRALVSFDSH